MAERSGAAVVTGAGRGIGRTIATVLADEGYSLAIQARTSADLQSLRTLLEGKSVGVEVVPGDATQESAAAELIDRCERTLGPVRVAVACAGQAMSAPLLRTEAADFERLFAVNTMSAFHLMKRAAKAMIDSGTPGRIVVVASTASVKGMRYTSAYCASKHAVLGLVRSAALELASKGITVNALCPGWVDTPMFEQTIDNISRKTGCTTEEARGRIEEMIPMRKVLTPEMVAEYVRYLVSPAAAQLTGQALVLDGGESIE
jgi:NAD(P)-dependent dehydrogenase (short-subunit alcohol dehydrogenase family)